MSKGTTGIILAAGDGGRLGPITADTPKPLVEVGNRPIIAYTIDALVAAGVRDLAIVTGYRAAEVRAALGDGREFGASIEYVANRSYDGGNGYSLYCARDYLRQGAVVTMADHLVSEDLVTRLLDSDPGAPRLAIDRGIEEPWIIDEGTKVRLGAGARISAIGKDLVDFDGIDTGAFYLLGDVVEYFGAAEPALELTDLIRGYLKRPGGFFARDVTGAAWWDIDTLADLVVAEARVRREVVR